jgi:uncharacterized lipoprotein YmbA
MRTPLARLAPLVALGLMAVGCALSPKDDPTQFYVLASQGDAAPDRTSELRLGLGPIGLPAYLRRPQMVTRQTEFEVHVSETNRWAETLEAGFSRVLREELQRATGAARVRTFPWSSSRSVDYAIEVDVTRFEGSSTGEVDLRAVWRVVDGETRQVVVRRESSLTQQAGGGTPEDLVAAQSRVIADLASEIAAAIPPGA